jgi:DNA-directed RNA polymerase specialized sigma24 family protein
MYAHLRANKELSDTDWVELSTAQDLTTDQGREALGQVIRRFRPACMARLTTKFGFKPPEAEDLLQGFLHEKIMMSGLLRQADPNRGRFRAFLLNALDNFVLTELRRRRSLKRKPLGPEVPIHGLADSELPHHVDSSEDRVEIVWVQAVIAGTLLNMQAELVRRGRHKVWSVFEHRILLPMLDDQPPMQYSELIERFGFKSPSDAFNVLATAKRMFQRHLKGVIAEYTVNDREVCEELAQLQSVVNKFASLSPSKTVPNKSSKSESSKAKWRNRSSSPATSNGPPPAGAELPD